MNKLHGRSSVNLLYALLITSILPSPLFSQSFRFGADLSYVNEMEDCGVIFKENQTPKDPYSIFKDHGCNLVRLRLWHTPGWYDDLNNGNRYSNLEDVKTAISRAKILDIEVLLDFHLSDQWADPGSQLAPAAWLPVVDNLQLLQDSLYNYIFNTLSHLHQNDLLPEMIQIGNETNKDILLSPDDNQNWSLTWSRNAPLFNTALQAVVDIEQLYGQEIKTMIHIAGPADTEWFINQFVTNGVTDFDMIGISYYWNWHMPTDLEDVQLIISNLRSNYPDKEVMIVETGYIWTNDWNDGADNILSNSHPDYAPVSPENQRDWLIDLTKAVMEGGGIGVVYWEPAWQSSSCSTEWGQGSHYENATFFDFDNNLLLPGGIEWMEYNYISSTNPGTGDNQININWDRPSAMVTVEKGSYPHKNTRYLLVDMLGKIWTSGRISSPKQTLSLNRLPAGYYVISVWNGNQLLGRKEIIPLK